MEVPGKTVWVLVMWLMSKNELKMKSIMTSFQNIYVCMFLVINWAFLYSFVYFLCTIYHCFIFPFWPSNKSSFIVIKYIFLNCLSLVFEIISDYINSSCDIAESSHKSYHDQRPADVLYGNGADWILPSCRGQQHTLNVLKPELKSYQEMKYDLYNLKMIDYKEMWLRQIYITCCVAENIWSVCITCETLWGKSKVVCLYPKQTFQHFDPKFSSYNMIKSVIQRHTPHIL